MGAGSDVMLVFFCSDNTHTHTHIHWYITNLTAFLTHIDIEKEYELKFIIK